MGTKKFNIIDIGAGDALKSRVLVKEALKQECEIKYVPIDISHESNLRLMKQVEKIFPELSMTAITGLYEDGLKWVSEYETDPSMYLFLGSTIGCQEKHERQEFFELVSSVMRNQDFLVISFDLWKNPQIIQKAYINEGQHKLFLKNSIKRINRELQGNFNLDTFIHHSYFDPFQNRMVGVVISTIDQTVTIGDQSFEFQQSEPTRVIFSKKWSFREIDRELERYPLEKVWAYTDQEQQFINLCYIKNEFVNQA